MIKKTADRPATEKDDPSPSLPPLIREMRQRNAK